MVKLRKRVIAGITRYYLEHSVRIKGNVEKRERYLGAEIPKDIDRLEREFLEEILKERWFDNFDKMKKGYAQQKRIEPPSARKRSAEAFAVRFTYNTNRIEGSTLTLRETSLLLEKGIAPNAKLMEDVREAEAHKNAFYEMLECKRDLSLELILYFHRQLFKDTKRDIAGKIRRHQVEISGSRFKPPLAVELDPLLREFFGWYNGNKEKLHPVELAALVHLKLVTIHPFADGNGRLSRLLMNFILNRHGFPMLDIAYDKRAGYYHALERAQLKRDEMIFVKWTCRRYEKENEGYLHGI